MTEVFPEDTHESVPSGSLQTISSPATDAKNAQATREEAVLPEVPQKTTIQASAQTPILQASPSVQYQTTADVENTLKNNPHLI